MSAHRTPGLVALLVLMPGMAACGAGLPDQALIEYNRPLAFLTEVLEAPPPDGTPTRAEAFPFETVRVTPWLVDENGPMLEDTITSDVDPTWYMCNMRPGQGLGACLLESLPLKVADIPDCPEPDLAGFDPADPDVEPPPSPCRVVNGTSYQPELTVPVDLNYLLGGDIELMMVGGTRGEVSRSDCEDSFLRKRKDLDERCILAAQRISVGPDTALLALAAEFGIDIGDQPLPEEPEEPDANLLISSASVIITSEAGAQIGQQDIAMGDTVMAPLGAELEVTISFDESQLQTYLVGVDTEDGVQSYDSEQEKASGSWFRTWGRLAGDGTQDPVAINRWRLEPGEDDEDEPPGGVAHMYYVARDGRVGVDWFWFAIEIE